jgi:hypothetical protein
MNSFLKHLRGLISSKFHQGEIFCQSLSQGYVLWRSAPGVVAAPCTCFPVFLVFSPSHSPAPPSQLLIVALNFPCSNYTVVSLSWLHLG